MVESTIVREPTKEETTGPVSGDNTSAFVPIVTPKGNVKTPKDRFHEEVENEAEKQRKKKQPFCTACAYADYKNAIRSVEAEKGYVADWKKIGLKIPKLSEYGPERFDFVKDGESRDDTRAKAGVIKYAKWKLYKCKVRPNHTVTIFE